MFQRVRSTGLALGVVTTASAAVLLAAVPASAATAPDWPSSRLPTGAGCAITAYSPYSSTVSGLNEYTFTDSQVPVVTGWTMNNQASVLTLVPGTTLVTTRITATQSCSGVGSVASGLVVGTTRLSDDVPFLRASTDAFRSVWASSNPLTPANAGAYRMPTAIVAPRYASFVLTDVWKLVGKSDFVGTPAIVTGPWSTKVLYVQRATTQVTAASRTSVAKGGKVTFRSTLRKAGTTAYIAAAGASMAFQTRLPGGAWQTRARVSTNASGVATYTFAPPRTMSWRWVHAGTRTGSFTAPSISAAKTIKVL